jgi:hypothetical protein
MLSVQPALLRLVVELALLRLAVEVELALLRLAVELELALLRHRCLTVTYQLQALGNDRCLF